MEECLAQCEEEVNALGFDVDPDSTYGQSAAGRTAHPRAAEPSAAELSSTVGSPKRHAIKGDHRRSGRQGRGPVRAGALTGAAG